MNTFATVAIIAIILLGIVLMVRALRSKDYNGDEKTLAHKDGLPILPRDEREPPAISENVPETPEVDSGSSAPDDALSNLAMAATQTTEVETADTVIAAPSAEAVEQSEAGEVFTKESPMIDRHLTEQQIIDQNNDPLLNAKDQVSILISPKTENSIVSGKVVLDIVRSYGLKYGALNMYHRYERDDGTGDLWFSMLGVDHAGLQAFDLNTLAETNYMGLALFLSLPHPHALRGFDSMVSVAQMIARDINAELLDAEGYVLDDAYLTKIRSQVEDY